MVLGADMVKAASIITQTVINIAVFVDQQALVKAADTTQMEPALMSTDLETDAFIATALAWEGVAAIVQAGFMTDLEPKTFGLNGHNSIGVLNLLLTNK